jgi:prefoldin subunit 5
MSLPVTELAEEVRESNRRLTAAIDALRGEAEDLRLEVAKINTSLTWMKSIGRVVAGSAGAVLMRVGNGVYRFGRVESEIARVGVEMNQIRKDTAESRAEVKADIAKLRGDMDQIRKDTAESRAEVRARDDRLSRTLERIEKALPPAPGGRL